MVLSKKKNVMAKRNKINTYFFCCFHAFFERSSVLKTWDEFFPICIVLKNLLRTIDFHFLYHWSFMWCLVLPIYMISH